VFLNFQSVDESERPFKSKLLSSTFFDYAVLFVMLYKVIPPLFGFDIAYCAVQGCTTL